MDETGDNMYTIETLSKINYRFLSDHYELTEEDVKKVNDCIGLIEASRTSETPLPGDVVQYTDEQGNYYPFAFIENVQDGEAYIAESASAYLDLNKGSDSGFSVSVSSGGAFHYIPIEKMKYTSKRVDRMFWHFGHCGACANGGIDFFAKVNIWECNLNKGNYTTKTHDKHYISYDPEPEKRDSRYKFSSNRYKAWKTENDFQAWLRTFRGVVEPGNWENQLIVWTYKNIEHHLSPEEYEDLNVPEDTFLMNGSIRRCKRVYDDKSYIVHTYFVWYWDKQKDFYERATEQNKVIDSYTLDWRTHKENEYARKELNSGKIQTINLKLEG